MIAYNFKSNFDEVQTVKRLSAAFRDLAASGASVFCWIQESRKAGSKENTVIPWKCIVPL